MFFFVFFFPFNVQYLREYQSNQFLPPCGKKIKTGSKSPAAVSTVVQYLKLTKPDLRGHQNDKATQAALNNRSLQSMPERRSIF